jgi:hypothetical protein
MARIPQASVRFDPPPVEELQAAVVEEIHALQIEMATVEHWLCWACQVAEGFYPDHPLDLKVLIVICNLVIFYIDDVLARDPASLQSFQRNLVAGRPQADPILECLAKKLIPRMWDYFDAFAADAIAIGFCEFINGTVMEGLTKMLALHPSARNFPEYVRLKSGAPAQYAYWLFPRQRHPDMGAYAQAIPDLLAFINRVNDILSFYKEELAGEEDNFVHMRAKISGKSVICTLEDICDETIQLIDNISATLADESAHSVFQDYIAGYLRFHMSTTRYRLEELMTEV